MPKPKARPHHMSWQAEKRDTCRRRFSAGCDQSKTTFCMHEVLSRCAYMESGPARGSGPCSRPVEAQAGNTRCRPAMPGSPPDHGERPYEETLGDAGVTRPKEVEPHPAACPVSCAKARGQASQALQQLLLETLSGMKTIHTMEFCTGLCCSGFQLSSCFPMTEARNEFARFLPRASERARGTHQLVAVGPWDADGENSCKINMANACFLLVQFFLHLEALSHGCIASVTGEAPISTRVVCRTLS